MNTFAVLSRVTSKRLKFSLSLEAKHLTAYGIGWSVSCNERDCGFLSKIAVGTRNDTQSGDSPFHPRLLFDVQGETLRVSFSRVLLGSEC